MRLWHKDLIPYLPRQQLLGQWRECCLIAKSIAEKGTPNHVLVNKVTDYPLEDFFTYGTCVLYTINERRGKCSSQAYERFCDNLEKAQCGSTKFFFAVNNIFISWHSDRYLRQCLYNLQEKYDCGAIPPEEWKRITDRWPEWR